MKNKTLAIDFDHVLHDAKKGFLDGQIYGEPVEGSVWTLNNLAKEYKLVVLTSRSPKDFLKVSAWLAEWGFPDMEVTNTKPVAAAYIDDRAIRFTSWPDIVKYFL